MIIEGKTIQNGEPTPENPVPIVSGWQCPVCGRVMSPYTYACYYCYFFPKNITQILPITKISWEHTESQTVPEIIYLKYPYNNN